LCGAKRTKRSEHISNMKKHSALSLNRRQFIQRTATGVALFNILPGPLLAGARSRPRQTERRRHRHWQPGRSRRGRGAGLGHNFVALCDVDDKYAAKEFAKYPKAKQFKDYR